VPDPVVTGIRHCFNYGTKHHFRVDATHLGAAVTPSVTDDDAIWVVDQNSVSIGVDFVEFDATPSKPPGLGGTGSLTVTVTNSDGGGSGSGTANDASYYTGT
jgi:hypothetical protein